MIRSLFSALGLLIRATLVLFLIAGLVFAAFAGYKGSQPMQQDGANGMTYWQFMRDRIGAIRELPAKCQQMHFTGFVLAVPLYPVLYTYVGMFPDSFLARLPSHTPPSRRMCNWLMYPLPGGRWWRSSPGMPG